MCTVVVCHSLATLHCMLVCMQVPAGQSTGQDPHWSLCWFGLSTEHVRVVAECCVTCPVWGHLACCWASVLFSVSLLLLLLLCIVYCCCVVMCVSVCVLWSFTLYR